VGAARAFRKPAYVETSLHLDVEFPEESPFQEPSQQAMFREFMTRVIGNSDIENEELVALEVGYRGSFLDDRLSVSLDLYYNLFFKETLLESYMPEGDLGMPDLTRAYFRFENADTVQAFLGGELAVRYSPTPQVSLLASWGYREGFQQETGKFLNTSPKHLLTLGGRFRTDSGFLGSLYAHSRSEFHEPFVGNPKGLLEPYLTQDMHNIFLLIGRVGWKFGHTGKLDMEAGVSLFLPVSPFAEPHFRYYEEGGGETVWGDRYGGDFLGRVMTAYLQGSF
jgi:hypothetical protein